MSSPPTYESFNPGNDLPSLAGKVVLVTGGTAGLGKASIETLAKHGPAHIYFTGRNVDAANSLIANVKKVAPSVSLTFLEMDFSSLASVKEACSKFVHDRLDILMCNAGIMAVPPGLSKDGYETQFATNHLAHAMVIKQLLPVMLRTAELPESDVRILSLTSLGWKAHPKSGMIFSDLETPQESILGNWLRYGQSKLANIIYAAELARRHPSLKTVSVHPGVVETGLVTNLPKWTQRAVCIINALQGVTLIKPEQGCFNQVWLAAGVKQSELVNGAFYLPIGILANDKLNDTAMSEKLAMDLWDFTEKALDQF
ncbi:short-chain dehydrogenase/ reductase-like protein [Pseudomassariella vexata]|uniref:Short-chain dehydrogenase/ reductase-like protein n=1 Tax=Pseudomassariella vexata TaxID=1141098 RepID=A0A1Y2DKN3_9PEZI|nr:short-chain dehydrogenase/ reductase-like protein [Pseudomassariella vexata]ORY59761.1 short-chain dehydrogenase/ reductase-like protein [Pseudomassariella vexata]